MTLCEKTRPGTVLFRGAFELLGKNRVFRRYSADIGEEYPGRAVCAAHGQSLGPVRRARRGVILNENGVYHPFFKLFPQTLLSHLFLF